MRVLLAGANGFIGRHVFAALMDAGHEVVAVVRNPALFRAHASGADVIACDFNSDVDPAVWTPRLAGIDAVVNCVGVLESTRGQNISAIHVATPLALYHACMNLGIRRVIHVSAVSADESAATDYALTKYRAEAELRALDLDWIVLRPSLVFAQDSYGGTSLMRGLAALPYYVPVVGKGEQPFRPIHAKDLSSGIVTLLGRKDIRHVTLEPAGPQVLGLAEVLLKIRAWLGFGAAQLVKVPFGLAAASARLGGWFGVTALNVTALKQLQHGNAGDPALWNDATRSHPDSMDAWLRREPAGVQDRWHARLFFLRPLARLVLAVVWIVSGVVGLTIGKDAALALLAVLPFSESVAAKLLLATCILDIAIGLGLLFRPRTPWLGVVQLAVVLGYTFALTVSAPGVWADPLGSILKNMPFVVLILVWMAIEDER